MPNDLWYFHESDLSKGNLTNFVRNLPDHLQRMFEDSFGGFNFVDKDVINVLQGYHGPHTNGASGDSKYIGPSNGLQEVRYWWGISKNLMLLPMGLLAFGINRAVQNTDWHSLYFDSKTGECLSHNRNEAIEKLNSKGLQLFQEGRYTEAAEYYNNAYQASSSDYKNKATFKINRDRAKAEIEAINLNSQGDDLFSKGKYAEAINKYQMDFDKSQISKYYNKYRYNRYKAEKAKAEIDAMNLNSEGDDLFSKGKYAEALNKYQLAYDKSEISIEYEKYRANREKAKAETDALNLNSEGDDLFSKGKYAEAINKYQMACDKSQISIEYDKYCDNREKAKAERDAINLTSEGDNLFSQRKYSEALSKYLKAYNKSTVHKDKFRAKRDKAKAERDAINLNTEGDILFSQGKYGEALSKYKTAYDKSLVEKEKNTYAVNINNAQANKNKLSILDTLWKEAWDAENDTDNDRSSQATELFQRVLSETKDAIKMFPYNSRFKQYETLVSLKIVGNELFNEGLELQQNGAKLLQEAQELKLQEKFKLARIKYMVAKSKFLKAEEKFKIGREKDQRFVSCVDFVQGQLNEIQQSREVIKQLTMSSKFLNLDIRVSRSDHTEADSCQGI